LAQVWLKSGVSLGHLPRAARSRAQLTAAHPVLMMPNVSFQPARPTQSATNYGSAEDGLEKVDPTTMLNKKTFKRGVAMSHAFLLFAIFIPPFMLSVQLSHNVDLQHFVGTFASKISYFVLVLILLVPMAHLTSRLHPWVFLMSVWIPGFIFIGIGWYYRDYAHSAVNALNSPDCGNFAEKRSLQQSFNLAQDLYDHCGKFVSFSIEECPTYAEVFSESPVDFMYLKSLEHRFQCAGICHSARRLWEGAGTSAPSCGLFAAQWVRGGEIEAEFMLWYSVFVVIAAVPVFITLLDSFFKDYYKPLSK